MIESMESRFIETETVPGDAKVIDHTWNHPNKKGGGPDRRFSNNYQIPVCLYEVAGFGSDDSGLVGLLEFSRTGVVAPFASAIKNLALRMGGQAALRQPQQSSATSEQAKPADQLNLSPALQKVAERVVITTVKSEEDPGTHQWNFNFKYSCRKCGGTIVHLPDNHTDESIASCKACGAEFGRMGDIKALAMLLAKEELRKHGLKPEDDTNVVYTEGGAAPTQ